MDTSGDPGEKSAVLVFLETRFFVTAATRNEYVPAASPVTVHVRSVDDFVAPLAHPVLAPVHVPPVPVATCTSYPMTDTVRVESPLLSHDTTTSPALAPATALTDDDVASEAVALADADALALAVAVAVAVADTVADAETLGEEVSVAEADAVVDSDGLAVELADAEAVAPGVALDVSDPDALDVADASPASPRMTGAPAPAALPPHAARSITAHATAALAALPLIESGMDAPKRLLRALIVGRASPGPSPLIVHVTVTLWGRGPREHRACTVYSSHSMHYALISRRCTPPSRSSRPPPVLRIPHPSGPGASRCTPIASEPRDAGRVHDSPPTAFGPPSGRSHRVHSVGAAELSHHPAQES